MAVPLLTSVTLPDDSSWTASERLRHRAAVESHQAGQLLHGKWGKPHRVDPADPRQPEVDLAEGLFPERLEHQKPHLQTNPGVATRTMLDPNHSVQNGTWTYTYAPGFPAADGSQRAHDHRSSIRSAIGRSTISRSPSTPVIPAGAPTTTACRSPACTPWESTSAQPVAPDLRRCERQLAVAIGVRGLRAGPGLRGDHAGFYNTNRRPLQSRTVYEDDPGNYAA